MRGFLLGSALTVQALAILGSVVDPSLGSWASTLGPGLSASYFASAAAAGQRLDALYLFASVLIKSGVAEVDVPVQARVGVVLVVILSECMRWMRGRLSRVHWGPFPLAWRSRFALVGAGASTLSVASIIG